MLGQHPGLYGFPELNLAAADTVGDWIRASMQVDMDWMRFGLVRTLAQFIHGSQSAEAVTGAERWLAEHAGMSTAALFVRLATHVAPRRPVEKSPHAISSDETLARLGRIAPDALYLHVTRHPHSACNSMMRSQWFRDGLRFGDIQAYDHSFQPPLFDPQFHWLSAHDRVLRFLETIPPERQYRVRGEDVLRDPRAALVPICEWIGVETGEDALEEMCHPERSPFAMPGPANAPHGNDPDFLRRPVLRPFTPPRAPLSGPVPWRGDGAGLIADVVALARRFGYEDERPEAPPRPRAFEGGCGKLVEMGFNGDGVPAAHANLLDNSHCGLAPMRTLRHTDYRPRPATGWINFGSYSGRDIVVSVFDSIAEPALVALRPGDGAKLWETPLDILPVRAGTRLRWVGGLLLARLRFADGTEEACIFAGNASEIVCLGQDGRPIWRNQSGEAGPPRCIRFTADNKLIFATTPLDPTTPAQLVKMDPVSGAILDRVRLRAETELDGRWISGGYQVFQSIVVAGDFAYVEGMFVPDTPQPPALDARLPTTLMRFRVSGTPGGRIERGTAAFAVDGPVLRQQIGRVGTRRQGGSPSAVLGADGAPVIVTNGFSENHTEARPEYILRAFRDAGAGLEPLWHHRIGGLADPKIAAAPAIDPVSQTYVAATRSALYLFGNVTCRRGETAPDLTVPAIDLLAGAFRREATAAEVSSPITLARDPGERGFVAYLGLAAWAPSSAREYAILTALQIDIAPYRVTPLWSGSVALTPEGVPLPTARSFAQPALFSYEVNGETKTGIAMSTMSGGMAVMR